MRRASLLLPCLLSLLLAVFGSTESRSQGVPPAHRGEVYGLFVGISKYEHMDKLAFCAADAPRMARLFEQLRGPLRMTPAHVTVLTDSQATRARVVAALQAIGRRLQPDDVFLFYFSGHGGGEDEPDVAPLDERDHHDETLVMWDSEGPHEDDLADDQLKEILARFPNRRKIILLDACFSGGFVADLSAEGTLVMAASLEDHTSSVAFAHRTGGAFTHALVTGLSGEADRDSDLVIRHEELERYLRTVIPLYCSECGRRNPAGSSRCFYDREKIGTRAHRPLFGVGWPGLTWALMDRPFQPDRCSSRADFRACSNSPNRCRCQVKGECGQAGCMAVGRRVVDGCSTAADRATCCQDPELCPCPEYGNCGMGECVAPEVEHCDDEQDRRQCSENPKDCPCGSFGDCNMASCR